MEVSVLLHAPAALSPERAPVPIEYEAAWAPSPVCAFWRTGRCHIVSQVPTVGHFIIEFCADFSLLVSVSPLQMSLVIGCV